MPAIDLSQVIIAIVSCVLTYFWNKRSPTPTAPTQDPVANHPVIQGILATLARLVASPLLTTPQAPPGLPANLLTGLLSKPINITVDGQMFTIDQNGFHVMNPSPSPSPATATIPVPSKN
jgi:hypothetical protein